MKSAPIKVGYRWPDEHGWSAGQVDGDGPQPDRRYALLGEGNPADALPAFQHAKSSVPMERSLSNWNDRIVFDVE